MQSELNNVLLHTIITSASEMNSATPKSGCSFWVKYTNNALF